MKIYGLKTLKEKHFSMEYNPFGWQQSILNKFLRKRDVLYEHIKHNEPYVSEYSSVNLGLQTFFYKASAPIFVAIDMFESMIRKGGTVEFVLKMNR